MKKISLCMIVRDEEENIARCLASAKSVADEIIIVDTGSIDRTTEICEEHSANVYTYEWDGDFSAARNYALSKVSGEWILLLDADEELAVRDADGLRRYLADTVYDMALIKLIHFYGSAEPDEKRAYVSGGLRLVRNTGSVRYVGRIHEKIDCDDEKIDRTMEAGRFLEVLHYGYMEQAEEKKAGRNISMLLKEITDAPDDPWPHFHLAAEYHRSGRLSEAYGEAQIAAALFISHNQKPHHLVYKLKYDILIEASCDDTAYKGIGKAIALYPDYTDLYFYRGILELRREDFESAKYTFILCLVLGHAGLEYLTLAECGGSLALFCLGLCHEALKETDEAAEAFRQAEMRNPGLKAANRKLSGLNDVWK